jgi:NAD(P)-dependent dehydrogenase (short-subunit alcohol dehydrogenase family)
MAVEFHSRGWNVTGCARSTDPLIELSTRLVNSCFFQYVDITKPTEVENFAQSVIQNVGVPDLLVNNAGVINQNARLTEISPEEFASVLSVNLGGIHNMIRTFVPIMEEQGHGVIANFSSYWGQSTAPEVGPYCASKWGVEGLTRSLAQELQDGLTAVAFNPGIIDTDMLRSCFGEGAASHEKPAEWAKHAVDRLEQISPSDNGKTILG